MVSEWLLSVPTLFGIESLVAREIRKLGYRTERVEDGRVSFYGDARAICRANIWLRTAERVQIKLGDFYAASFNDLFEQTKILPWPELLPADAVFPVNGHSLSSKLASVPDCQSIIKKAVVESLKSRWKTEWFSETGSLYRIHFNIIKDRVTVYADTSGEGLHKRGYREDSTLTPIRETLAAALVELSGWRPGHALWDPFCGSGTIAIEAAMTAANRAPGLERGFAAESWRMAGAGAGAGAEEDGRGEAPLKRLFDEERAKARKIYEETVGVGKSGGGSDGSDNHGSSNRSSDSNGGGGSSIGGSGSGVAVMIAGSDISRRCVLAARQNAARAGVTPFVRFFQLNAEDMDPRHNKLRETGVKFPERGSIVANPPYGERHGDLEEAIATCRDWAPALGAFYDWNWCIISALDNFERLIGRNALKRRKLYNGKIRCQAYMYRNKK